MAKLGRKRTPKRPPVRVPGRRGWLGPGGGQDSTIHVPASFRGTTVQVCGLHPFSVGAGTSMAGVPIGVHERTTATVCADPISWFKEGTIGNPSLFVMGLPALGKTSLVSRMIIGLTGYGVLPFVLGDTRPDYVAIIEKMGGQVHHLGRHRDYINPLDPGESKTAADRLRGAGFEREAQEVEADAHGRRLTTVLGLIAIQRKGPTTEGEEAVLDRALHILDDRTDRVAILDDLLAVVREGPAELRAAVIDRGKWDIYQSKTEALELSLSLLATTGFGGLFSRASTKVMRRDTPVVYDISSIPVGESDMLAAALLACWSNGFATVNIAQILADVGLEPRRHYFLVMDELHRILRAGGGRMVDHIDHLTRLNRNEGAGQVMITHTMKDLKALPESERLKAMGFIERSGMVILGGLPGAEMPDLTPVLPLSEEEQAKLASWATPASFSSREGEKQVPPGRGRFLIKVGKNPGIPVLVRLTDAELSLTNTNRRWQQSSRRSALIDAEATS